MGGYQGTPGSPVTGSYLGVAQPNNGLHRIRITPNIEAVVCLYEKDAEESGSIWDNK